MIIIGRFLFIAVVRMQNQFVKLEFVYLQSKISANAYTVTIKPGFFNIAFNKFSVI